MIETFSNLFNFLFIRILLIFRSSVLFHKINELSWYKNMLTNWVYDLQYDRGDKILEIGCATGVLSRQLAGHGAKVTAIDYSASMLKAARLNNPDGIDFTNADASKLPYRNNSFDYVIAASLINIVDNPVLVLSEMIRVCRVEGRISILVPQKGMTDTNVDQLIANLKLKGFSRAALLAWHQYAPKVAVDRLIKHFDGMGAKELRTSAGLNGMIVTVTGVKK